MQEISNLKVSINGEELHLLPQRALYRPYNKTVYVADTHWGKSATFRKHHIPLPVGEVKDDLSRLTQLVQITRAGRLVILGDLIHSAHHFEENISTQIEVWRKQHSDLQIQLVPGNHDRGVEILVDRWQIEVLPERYEDQGFDLSHQPVKSEKNYLLCGHLHPIWTLHGFGKQAVEAPCFVQTDHTMVLPAFNHFTGKRNALPRDMCAKHIYMVSEKKVFQIV